MNTNMQITKSDKQRLDEMLLRACISGKYYQELEEKIGRAQAVPSAQIDADVVTMNTKIRVSDLDTRQLFTMELVFPGDADMDENKISVLSPAGTALLGSRVGEMVGWYVPEHWRSPWPFRHIRIEEIVQQPEAAEELFV
jgi:regulator of nucleoside diphosphate kinase